jgi:cyclic pyranopterin phosphate synthase
MPFAGGEVVPLAAVRARLEAEGFSLLPDSWRGWGPARHFTARDGRGPGGPRQGLIGFIGAMTENFCDDCNRARVAADGGFQACLGGQRRAPLRELLRAGADDEALAAAVRGELAQKDPRHHMTEPGLVLLPMRGLGG